jgi:predicted ester cyclase
MVRTNDRPADAGPRFTTGIGHPPTGKPMTLDVIDIGRFDNGKLVENWGVPDRLAVLLQLGMFPPRTP